MNNCTRVLRALACSLVMIFAGSAGAFSQQIENGITLSNGDYLGFLEYKPTNYDASGKTKYPIIVFLHGIGERGNGTTQLRNVACCGLPRIIKLGHPMTFTWNGKTETFLVLSPQSPPKYGMWQNFYIEELIDYAKQNLQIDTNRIYLTGLSMGGGGTYRYISMDPNQPRNIAAAATICAPCVFVNGKYAAEAKLPVWSFHAADDNVAPAHCTETAISRINDFNPQVKPLMDIWPTGGHGVWDRVYTDTNYKFQGIVNIYEWFLGQNKSLPVNKLPVARAGNTVHTSTGLGVATLDASASTDADGKLVRYVWKKISGPSAGVITEAFGPNSSTTVTNLTVAGTYKYQLAVVDNRAAFTLDTVTVVVEQTPNKPPVVSVTAEDTVRLSFRNKGLLNANASKDPDGWISAFKWTKVSGPAGSGFENANTGKTFATDLVVGVYVFRVTATDNEGMSASKDVAVHVVNEVKPQPEPAPVPDQDPPVTAPPAETTPPPATLPPAETTPPPVTLPPPTTPDGNQPPLVNAGLDQVLKLSYRDKVLLNATASKDPDGWISAFKWLQVSGPASSGFENANTAKTFATGLKAGTYVFRVIVTDNKASTNSGDVVIQVIDDRPVPSPNKPPVTIAGDDQVLKLSYRDKVLLNATASKDPDGWISAFKWTQVSGPASGGFENANTAKTFATGLKAGTYIFRVTAYDNLGASASDELVVKVEGTPVPVPVPNTLPVAIAGDDQVVKLSYRNKALLNATPSFDPDGWVKAFRWEKISGPAQGTLENASAGKTFAIDLVEGVYTFRIIVTDSKDATAVDDVVLTVVNDLRATTTSAATAGDIAHLSVPTASSRLTIYPNPAPGAAVLNLSSAASGHTVVNIYSTAGAIKKTVSFNKAAGTVSQSIDLGGLTAGLYYLEAVTGNQRTVTKLIKL